MAIITSENKLLSLERKKWDEGFSFVAGVDEVGRGPLAGPVTAAAVVFPKHIPELPAVNDSKQLTHQRRLELRDEIMAVPGVQYAISQLEPDEIDRINILQASMEAMRRAIAQLQNVDYVLVDGNRLPTLEIPAEFIIKGDAKSASIAAASILAKVHRDELMERYAEEYPGYGFENHKGYGTKEHVAALEKLGITPIHRKSFAPVRDILKPPPEQLELF
jgi:ribonuclease HII